MFVEMTPAQTGIVTENDFADPKMWAEHYREFSMGTVGTGIAIGDYDGDGKPDIFVVSKTGPCRLFRNLGAWKFEDVTDRAGLSAGGTGWADTAKSWIGLGGTTLGDSPDRWKQGAVFVDVNNDGWLDLFVCRFNAPNWLFINQGDGTFKEEAAARGLAVVDASGVGAFCDYDRDGWLDVYVTTSLLDGSQHPNGGRGHLFHNRGDGKFVEMTDQAGIKGETLAHSATWWDFDGDGWPDLYVANDFSGPDLLYRNNHNGTFAEVRDRAVPHTPYSSMGADLGDVDNDGRLDLFVGDMAPTSHEKYQRGMAYSRSLGNTIDPLARGSPQFSHNALYLATGTGRCREVAYLAGLAATDWTWAARFEDLDNDGRIDLFITTGMSREFQNADLLDRSVRAENSAERVGIMRGSPILAESNLAYRNLGDLRFEETGAAWGLNQSGVSFGAAFGDLDGDGDLDLVFANYQGGVTVLRNDADTGHRVEVALRGVHSNRFGVGARVRIETDSGEQVRELVVARGYLSSSEPMMHFGLGGDTRIKRLTVTWPDGGEQSYVDLAADRKFVITEPGMKSERASNLPAVALESAYFRAVPSVATMGVTGDDKATPDELPLMGTVRSAPSVAVGDLDGDGRNEWVVGRTGDQPLRVIGSGRIRQLVTSPGDDGPIALLDANGDGALDIFVTKADSAQPQLLLNDGHGAFQSTPDGIVPVLQIRAGAVAAADFDRDGSVDIFIGARELAGQYPDGQASVLLRGKRVSAAAASGDRASGPKFEDMIATVAPELREVGLVKAALWSDVDGDGWPDLVIATEWGGVRCFHNAGGKRLEDWTSKLGFNSAGTGWWTALAAADLNGDGRPDFVAGNVGLNTPYHADAAHPAVLFAGDFTGRGRPQVIEAYYEGETLYPWRTRKELGALIPSVLKRYPRNDLYARAAVTDLVGPEKLKAAKKFTATELRSGVLLSQSDGTYRFEALPRIAQSAPLTGIVTADFDGDGRLDIFAVQNTVARENSVERFEGGLGQLLLGDGHGGFTAVAPVHAGVTLPDSANSGVTFDFDADGGADLLVIRADGKIRAFQNQRKKTSTAADLASKERKTP
jgi:hypothetical protein